VCTRSRTVYPAVWKKSTWNCRCFVARKTPGDTAEITGNPNLTLTIPVALTATSPPPRGRKLHPGDLDAPAGLRFARSADVLPSARRQTVTAGFTHSTLRPETGERGEIHVFLGCTLTELKTSRVAAAEGNGTPN